MHFILKIDLRLGGVAGIMHFILTIDLRLGGVAGIMHFILTTNHRRGQVARDKGKQTRKRAAAWQKQTKMAAADTERGHSVAEIGNNGWFRHRTKPQRGRNRQRRRRLTQKRKVTWQKQAGMAEIDTETGYSVAETAESNRN